MENDALISTQQNASAELSLLTNQHDWSQTSLGHQDQWPQSLKTTVSMLLSSKFPMFLWWGPDCIQFYNDAYRPSLGEKHPKAIGQKGEECWPEIWPIIKPQMDEVRATGIANWHENLLVPINRSGFLEEVYWTYSYSPIHVESGDVGGILVVVNETTEKVLNDRQLQTLRNLGRESLETKTVEDVFKKAVGVLHTNPFDFPFSLLYSVESNGTIARLAGSSGFSDESGIQEQVDLNANSSYGWPLAELVRTQKPILIESLEGFGTLPKGPWPFPPQKALLMPVTQPGQEHPYAILVTGISPMRHFDESYQGFFRLLSDQIAIAITNARAYEEERKRAEALAEIDQAKTNFFSNVSHEFRTPITLMLGPLEEILNKRSTTLNEHEKANIETAHRNALRLLKLVNSLLDFTSIESGRYHVDFELINLADLTNELCGNFRSLIEKAGLHFSVRTDYFIQPVYVDRSMWEKIVFNLLSNAFKYTLNGEIKVSFGAEDNHAVLRVSDTGVGIPENEVNKVFERFHRVYNTAGRTYEGTGIGLSLIRELVKIHGGSIEVQSKLGEGSTFTVRIPFGREHLAAYPLRHRHDEVESVQASAYLEDVQAMLNQTASAHHISRFETEGKAKILIVDDNADMRKFIEGLLLPSYNTITAANGLEALHRINEQAPDIILTDYMMPILDGKQLIREIRNNPKTKNIPILLLTARAGEEAKIEGYELGANDYLVKPFSSKELLARIKSHLEVNDLRRHAETSAIKERERLYSLFMQAPAMIAVLRGPELRFELANPIYLNVISRDMSIIGKPVLEVLPEIKGQEIENILFTVYKSGIPYEGNKQLVKLDVNNDGNIEDAYFNFVYQPIVDDKGKVDGVLVHAIDVTETLQSLN